MFIYLALAVQTECGYSIKDALGIPGYPGNPCTVQRILGLPEATTSDFSIQSLQGHISTSMCKVENF